MVQNIKRIAAAVIILLFISGFFFLNEGNKKPASGEKETVVADQEGIMAVRMVHNAAVFKLTQLQEEQRSLNESEEVLNSYFNGELLQHSLSWLEKDENEDIELFLRTDTTGSPLVADETGDQITLIWDSPRSRETEVTYKKTTNDVWVAVEMNTSIGSE